jgi:chromosome segregation ATPase
MLEDTAKTATLQSRLDHMASEMTNLQHTLESANLTLQSLRDQDIKARDTIRHNDEVIGQHTKKLEEMTRALTVAQKANSDVCLQPACARTFNSLLITACHNRWNINQLMNVI